MTQEVIPYREEYFSQSLKFRRLVTNDPSIENSTYALALMYAGGGVDVIGPVENLSIPFAVDYSHSAHAIISLAKEFIIFPSCKTKEKDYKKFMYFDDSGNAISLNCNFPIEFNTHASNLSPKDVFEICIKFGRQSVGNVLSMWKDIVYREMLAYTKRRLDDYGWGRYEVTDSMRSQIRDLLEELSPAQATNIIWTSVRDVAAFQKEKGLCDKQTFNYAASFIGQKFNRAKANGWDIRPFDQQREVGVSAITQTFFYRTLPIGDSWFETVVSQKVVESFL